MNREVRIAVLLGGPSAEREVSLRSGAAVASALRSRGHEVTEIDPVGEWSLPAGIEVVFLALHGTYGEDGTVQSELELLGVPYTGCGVEASRVAFDKVATKERLVQAGVPTAPHCVVADPSAPWPAGWKPPVVLKPVCQGSSVGLHFVEDTADWPAALKASLAYDTRVLVEERIVGREVTVGILEGKALPVVEVRPHSGAYDYRSKYTRGATEYLCPAPFAPEVTARLQRTALEAFQAVGGRDYARVDIMVRNDREPVVLELNTLPGMTETSLLPKAAAVAGLDFATRLLPKAAAVAGLDFATLCERMVQLALARAPRPAQLVRPD